MLGEGDFLLKQRRRETTFYLGEELARELEDYRRTFAVPPSASALIREALRRFLEEARQGEGTLAPRAWVEATEPLIRRLVLEGVSVPTEEILQGLEEAEANWRADLLGENR